MVKQQKRPGRWVYGLAVGLIAVGIGAVVWTAIQAMVMARTIDEGLTRAIMPGQMEVDLDQPGRVSIWYEYQSTIDGQAFSTPSDSPDVTCRITFKDDQQLIKATPISGRGSYQFGSKQGKSMFNFQADRPGTYVIDVKYNPPPYSDDDDSRGGVPSSFRGKFVMAVGSLKIEGILKGTFTVMIGGCGSALLLLPGIGLLIVTLVLRTLAKKRLETTKPA